MYNFILNIELYNFNNILENKFIYLTEYLITDNLMQHLLLFHHIHKYNASFSIRHIFIMNIEYNK